MAFNRIPKNQLINWLKTIDQNKMADQWWNWKYWRNWLVVFTFPSILVYNKFQGRPYRISYEECRSRWKRNQRPWLFSSCYYVCYVVTFWSSIAFNQFNSFNAFHWRILRPRTWSIPPNLPPPVGMTHGKCLNTNANFRLCRHTNWLTKRAFHGAEKATCPAHFPVAATIMA